MDVIFIGQANVLDSWTSNILCTFLVNGNIDVLVVRTYINGFPTNIEWSIHEDGLEDGFFISVGET